MADTPARRIPPTPRPSATDLDPHARVVAATVLWVSAEPSERSGAEAYWAHNRQSRNRR